MHGFVEVIKNAGLCGGDKECTGFVEVIKNARALWR